MPNARLWPRMTLVDPGRTHTDMGRTCELHLLAVVCHPLNKHAAALISFEEKITVFSQAETMEEIAESMKITVQCIINLE